MLKTLPFGGNAPQYKGQTFPGVTLAFARVVLPYKSQSFTRSNRGAASFMLPSQTLF